ncbi:nuclear pore complex protein Nup205-like [Bolinopsis microptera]|uniref:nuclear pore complex protein Nup205-like n=1 Tax=Bolinopsis microptera TaxID=2820187 RepID=UPI003078EA40
MTSFLFPGLWGSQSELILTVNNIIRNKTAVPDQLHLLLKKHKPDFNALFASPERDVRDRQTVLKSVTEGILLPGNTTPRTLPKLFTQEVVLLSDVLKLNELVCVDLLLAGEEHLPRFPTLTRGLLAVLLFYDGKRSMATCLKTLVQMREGKTWTFGLQHNVVDMVTGFTSNLMNEGLVQKILDILVTTDVTTELEKLEQGHAVGDVTHRLMLREAITDFRATLSEVIFVWSCQNPLPANDCLKVLCHVKKHCNTSKEGTLEADTAALFMTILYNIDLEPLADNATSLMTDSTFTKNFNQELTEVSSTKSSEGLLAALHLVWAVSVNVCSTTHSAQHLDKLLQEEEMLLDWTFKHGGVEFLTGMLLKSTAFFQEEYYVARIHTLITNMIYYLPLRIGEIQADSKQQLDSNLKSEYEKLLELMAVLYKGESSGLCDMFWYPDSPGSPSNKDNNNFSKQSGLFKFVKVGAEQVTPHLFVQYLKFLCAISNTTQSARHCYNLLRSDSAYGSGNSLVTWDHFFGSLEQYLWHIHEQLEGVKLEQNVSVPTITPEELDALQSVLSLTKHILALDEDLRTTMAENSQWHIVSTLFGLLSCPVVPQLKGSILDCIAVLTETPELCLSLWQQLEATQILPTVQTNTTKLGIQSELEEIESRSETYPETRGFLNLLKGLLSTTIPGSLGVGYRQPGLIPYLNFVKESVFLKFDIRAYSDNNEMWEVAAECMGIFHVFLDQFQVNEQDLEETVNSPAYHLLTQLLNDTPLLIKIMTVVESASKVLSKGERLKGGHLSAAKSAVKLLALTLEMQEEMLSLLRESSATTIVTPLQQLLLTINPSTRNSDFILHIAKFMIPLNTDQDIVHGCLKLLVAVCSKPGTLSPVSIILTQKSAVAEELMQSLVERLETDEPETASGSSGEHNAIRQKILNLLISLLDFAPPNIGYYLLGFDITRPLNKTVLQEPGIQGCKRTCLHSVIDLLFKELPPNSLYDTPVLSHLCYQLLLKLSTNRHTGAAVLRYLRSTYDFFGKFLEIHPWSTDSSRLEHQTEFLQLLALELLVTSRANLTSYLQRLLLGLAGPNSTIQGPFHALEGSRKLLSLLESVCKMDVGTFVPLELNYFDTEKLEMLIKQHHYKEGGLSLVNVVTLHKTLQSELNMVSNNNIPIAQRNEINEEIKAILNNTVERNTIRRKISLKRKAFDAWRQVVEVMIVGCNNELVPSRQTLLVELTQAILAKSRDGQPLSGLLSSASGCVVLLIQQLRYTSQIPNTDIVLEGADPLPPGLLQTMTRNLVEAIIQCGGNMQQARAHLYAALLHCLKMSVSNDTNDVKLGGAIAQGYQIVDSDSLAVLCSYGDIFIESLCKDASKGHGVTKILAFSLLSIILGADTYQNWLKHLNSKGYLKHFIESINTDNQNLLMGLNSDNIKPLFIYEAKLAFLAQIAQTEAGATTLLEAGIIPRLSELTILHQLPVSSELYKQHLLVQPVFTLLTSLLTSLGSKHVVANREASHLVCVHSELISSIVKSNPGEERSKQDYQDLCVVTSLLAWLRAHQHDLHDEDVAVSIQLQSTSTQLQRHLINLLHSLHLPGKCTSADTDLEVQTIKLQIITNVVSYCVSAMGNTSVIHAVFSPELGTKKGNNLNLLIGLLQKGLEASSHHSDAYSQLIHKALHVNQLSTEEQRELASCIAPDTEKCSAVQRAKYAELRLEQLAETKDKELSLYTQLIENLVFLLWRHVQYYTVYCKDPTEGIGGEPLPKKLLSSNQDYIKNLTRELPLHLTDPLLKKIVDFCSSKISSSMTSSFTSALVRRVRKLMTA